MVLVPVEPVGLGVGLGFVFSIVGLGLFAKLQFRPLLIAPELNYGPVLGYLFSNPSKECPPKFVHWLRATTEKIAVPVLFTTLS